MAGILITVGSDVEKDHEGMREYFIRHKGLKATHDEAWEFARLSKFSRGRSVDFNFIVHEPVSVWVVGTLIYRGRVGRDALEAIWRDLHGSGLQALSEHCDGPFLLAVKDSREYSLKLMTDHAGIVNVYAYNSGLHCALGTSSLALSSHYPVTLNPDGAAQFLRTSNVYGSDTIYHEITLLEPASIYHITGPAQISRTQYWKSPVEIRDDLSFDHARDLIAERLLDRAALLSREDLVCDFTAGFDSRLLVSAFSCHRPLSGLPTFVFGPGESREVRLVKEYCRSLGCLNHHLELPDDWGEILPEYLARALIVTDGEENAVVYAPILLAQERKAASSSCSVNGLGGELYRDFWWIQELYGSRRPANLERLISMRILQYEYDYSIFSEDWRPRMQGVKDTLKSVFQDTLSDMDPQSSYNTLQIDNLYFREKIRRWAGRTMSSSSQIISALAPLTLKACLDAVMTVPPGYKRNGRLVKSMVERLSGPLSDLRMLNGAPCRNITFRNIHRFSPLLLDYARKGIRKAVQKTLKRTILLDGTLGYQQSWYFSSLFSHDSFTRDFTYDSLLTKDLYDPEAYTRFYENAQKPGFPYYSQLGNIITLEMRMRKESEGHRI